MKHVCQDDRCDRDDDQKPGRMDQGQRPDVPTCFLTEKHYVLQAAGHCGVPCGDPVEAIDIAEERHAQERDAEDKDGDQADR